MPAQGQSVDGVARPDSLEQMGEALRGQKGDEMAAIC